MTLRVPRPALAAGMLLVALAAPAHATDFDFGDLQWNGHADTGFLPSSGSFLCTGGDQCSSDVDHGVLGGGLSYTADGLTATATGWYLGRQVAAMQDHENAYPTHEAGLGVYHVAGNNSDDNITSGESLVLTFSHAVHLTGFDLRADGHDTTSWAPGSTFLFSVDGGASSSWLLPAGSGSIGGLDLYGTTFTFSYGGTHADQFYLAGMTVSAVPEPATAALMLAGLGALAFARRQRRGR